MNVVVQKYGGSSVENKEKLENICKNIVSYKNKKNNLVVVVSAQGKCTDELIKKAKEYSGTPSKRDLDFLLTTGEMQTVALLSMMLNNLGYDTIGLTGEQAGIISDSTYGDARIESIYIDNIVSYLKSGKIVVVTGFQAVDKLGNLTTLGRGGSDLSAVALAAALKAKKCEIYTDVDGVFSADPRIISRAKLLKSISYDEMLEAASLGSKVMHNRAVNTGKRYNIPIIVKNSQKKTKGSVITDSFEEIPEEEPFENNKVKFITKRENMTKISIVGDMMMSNRELVYDIFDIAKKLEISIEMISFSELSINIAVQAEKAVEFMNVLHDELFKEE